MANRLPLKDRMRDHPMFADTSLRCKLCGASYDEDDPPDEALKGYCSDYCEWKDRKIDEAEQRREDR
jgi:hypothetical protein